MTIAPAHDGEWRIYRTLDRPAWADGSRLPASWWRYPGVAVVRPDQAHHFPDARFGPGQRLPSQSLEDEVKPENPPHVARGG